MFLSRHFDPFHLYDDLFDDRLVLVHPSSRSHANRGSSDTHNKPWTATLRLSGYKPEEVNVERSEDNATLKVHARQGSGDDYSEVRKTIHVPDNVDRDQVDVDFSREGILVVRAPYKATKSDASSRQQQQPLMNIDPLWASVLAPWNNEMRTLRDQMWQLMDHSFPGSMSPTFVQDDQGTTHLNMDFDLRGYRPEEISIQHDKHCVTVEARHEQQSGDGSSFKHFKRVFTLPENVNSDQLECKLMPDGRLRLDAPCQLKEPTTAQEVEEKKEVSIPVQRASAQS